MTDRYDSLYDTVNARRFGSLRNDDSVTETMCDAFFKTRSSLEDITKSVQGALNAVGDQPVQSDKAIERDLPVSQDQNAEGTNGMIPTRSAEVENQAQDLQRGEESENCPKSSIVAKPVGKLEDLSHLAMFGRQKTVLRRSQIKSESIHESVSVSHAKSVQQSKPPRVMQLAAPERNVVPMSASRPRATALQKNTAVRVVGSLTSQKNETSGVITRSRYKELNMTPIAKHRAPAEKDRGDHNKDLRSDIRKMRLSTDRQARDRTPRSNVSSAAAAKKMQHSAAPVRIRRNEQTEIRGDSFLKNDVVPSEREFRHELNNRNPSLGSVRRGLSSTPKSETKEPQSDDLARTSVSRDHQIHGPMNTLKPQASTVSRAATGTPVASNTLQSKTRSSSATRTLDRPLNIARSTVQRANVKHCGNDARSSSQSSARPSRANCLTIGPQNVNRPNFSKPSRNQPATAQAVVPVKENALLASVKPASTQRSSAAKAVAVQSSAQRSADHRPSQPRSSVIRHSPVRRGGGEGTPVHGFRKELRRYPVPTHATPLHRRPTVCHEFHFEQKHPQKDAESKLKRAAPVGTEPSSARRLSRNELRAMVERLAVPKRVAATAMRTPLRIRNEQTHGVRCVKIRSRSSSLSRRPVSAQDNIGGVPAARTLLFSTDENPRCVSVEPGTQQELH